MSDFIRDLELELLGAARRRAARKPRPRIPWRPLLGVATVAAAIAAVLALVPRSQHPPAPPGKPPEKAAGFAIAAASDARPCAPGRLDAAAKAPDDVAAILGIVRRKPQAGDALPASLRGALPAGDDAGHLARRFGDLRVVPTGDLLAEPCGKRRLRSGACLVSRGEQWACFTVGQIEAGRAFALADGGRLIGLVPDGTKVVGVNGRRYPALSNVVDTVVPLRPGDRVSTRLVHLDWSVLVLNATRIAGLAGATSDELERTLGVTAMRGNAQGAATSNAVYYSNAGQKSRARTVAASLDIRTVAPLPHELDRGYAITVVLGRMR